MEASAQLKEAVKWMWSLGDYGRVAQRLMPCAERLAEATGVGPGMSVLDVAAGNGNFAIAAARRGATVIASDLTPRMVELGKARSADEGLEIAWMEADAEQLPFESEQFDLVASVFGAMFAPRSERVATELFRVVKPGGVVAMANYADAGFLGAFSRLLYRLGPASPVQYESPFRWGELEVVRQRFAGLAEEIIVEPCTLSFEFDSAEEALETWEATNGPLIAIKTMSSPETVAALRRDALSLITNIGKSVDGRLRLDSQYVQIMAHKAGVRE
ncbi:MAG TPA: methyltransferase domain-containing protein [Nitrolancea sp.]